LEALEGLLGLLLLVVAILTMLRRPVAMALLLCGTLGLMAFTLTQFKGFTRHHGHLFMLLIAASWLAANDAAQCASVWGYSIGSTCGSNGTAR